VRGINPKKFEEEVQEKAVIGKRSKAGQIVNLLREIDVMAANCKTSCCF
jgi:hypothetical protein